MSYGPKIVDRSTTKPTYLIVVEDPTAKGNISYAMSRDITECGNYLEFRGFALTKTKADQLKKEPYVVINAKEELVEINHKIPWQRIVRMESVTYKIPQNGE